MLVAKIFDIADEQWGLVTTSQAGQVGVSAQAMARFVQDGMLERLAHGVYRVVGAASPVDDLRAAWLAQAPTLSAVARLRKPDAVLSHRTAARYHELGDLDADVFEFTVATRRQSKRRDVRFHREVLNRSDWQIVSGLPVTTIPKTIADLAKTRTDGGHLAGVVRDAMAVAAVTADEISDALRPYAHHYGARLGDGHGLLAQFLELAGIPQATQEAARLTAPRVSRADASILLALALLDPRIPRELRNRAAHFGLSEAELREVQNRLGITVEPGALQAALEAAHTARERQLKTARRETA